MRFETRFRTKIGRKIARAPCLLLSYPPTTQPSNDSDTKTERACKTHRRNCLRHPHPTRHDGQSPPTEPRDGDLVLHVRHLALEVDETHVVEFAQHLAFHFGAVRVRGGEEGQAVGESSKGAGEFVVPGEKEAGSVGEFRVIRSKAVGHMGRTCGSLLDLGCGSDA